VAAAAGAGVVELSDQLRLITYAHEVGWANWLDPLDAYREAQALFFADPEDFRVKVPLGDADKVSHSH
jgi:hypothetical protein